MKMALNEYWMIFYAHKSVFDQQWNIKYECIRVNFLSKHGAVPFLCQWQIFGNENAQNAVNNLFFLFVKCF